MRPRAAGESARAAEMLTTMHLEGRTASSMARNSATNADWGPMMVLVSIRPRRPYWPSEASLSTATEN